MKLHKLFIAVFSVSALLLPVTGFAGALDRGPMQQRYNQAADEMIRVPGVVGMYEQDAVAALQQAGVAPNVEYEKKIVEDLAGKEGTVIDQEPSAGGITMLGSTVTITVYWPPSAGDLPAEGSDGQYGDEGAGQWEEPAGGAQPPAYEEPAPQWGGGSQPPSGGGWTPPPAPAPQPYVSPQPYAAPEPTAQPAVPASGRRVGPVPAPVAVPRVPAGNAGRQPAAQPSRPVTIEATPVNPTVTPVAPRAATPAATPIQQQLDTKVPARVEIRDKMKGAGRGITAGPINPTGTPAQPASGQKPSTQVPIIVTPVQPTATQAHQQPAAPAPIVMTPVQQIVTPVSQGAVTTQSSSNESQTQQDGSCRSWYAIANDITMEAQRIAKELGCAPFPTPALWKACIKHIDKIGKWNAYNMQLKKRWNRLVKKTSWAAIGPRELTFGKTHNGRIFGTTGRMFITPEPINKENVNIKLTKKAGKSRTSVTVCSYMPGGDRIKEWQLESPKGNGNKGQVWTKDLSNMDGKLLSIHLDGKSAADTFKYSLFLENN